MMVRLTKEQQIGELTDLKARHDLNVREIKLRELDVWNVSGLEISFPDQVRLGSSEPKSRFKSFEDLDASRWFNRP